MGYTAHTVGGGCTRFKRYQSIPCFQTNIQDRFLECDVAVAGRILHMHPERHAEPVVHISCTWLHVCTADTSLCPPSSVLVFHSPSRARNLPSLPLVRLSVLEWEPTCPLIRTRLPANPAIAASKQNTPQRNCSQKAGAKRTQAKGHDSSLGPHGVPVEGVDGVEHGGYGECR